MGLTRGLPWPRDLTAMDSVAQRPLPALGPSSVVRVSSSGSRGQQTCPVKQSMGQSPVLGTGTPRHPVSTRVPHVLVSPTCGHCGPDVTHSPGVGK